VLDIADGFDDQRRRFRDVTRRAPGRHADRDGDRMQADALERHRRRRSGHLGSHPGGGWGGSWPRYTACDVRRQGGSAIERARWLSGVEAALPSSSMPPATAKRSRIRANDPLAHDRRWQARDVGALLIAIPLSAASTRASSLTSVEE